MATSSSDGSCTAPADFQLSSELEDTSNRLSANLLKCPLCHSSRRTFHCRQCIQNGEFTHSNAICAERFADKQMRLLRLKAARAQLEEKCTKALQRSKQKDKLLCDISICKERVELLQSLVKETKRSIHEGNQLLYTLKDSNSQLNQLLPRYEERIERLHCYVNNIRAKQERQQEAVNKKREQLKSVIRIAVSQLIQYIFPLSRVQPNKSLCSSEDSDSMTSDNVTSALAEASGTSYVRGRWISDKENSLEIHHCIVEPTLPGTGDYSAYSLWVAANKDGVPGANKENAMHNPAYNISAGLSFTTQLVNVIASFVNVRLPYKLTCGEFGHEMSDQKFARKVARLNSNVLHLCFTQNTDVKILHPMHTLQNLMHLLNFEISDLGRIGPMEADPAIIAQFHNQLVPDLENSDDSGSDEEEDACAGWEAVPNIACPEMTVPIPSAMVTQQSSSMQVHQSVAGGLVTSAAASIASIWRGWTNK